MSTRLILIAAFAIAACGPAARPEPSAPTPSPTPTTPTPPAPAPPLHLVVPAPVAVELVGTDTFVLAPQAIIVAGGGAHAERIGYYLAGIIGNTRESTPRVLTTADTTTSIIELTIDPSQSMHDEGYELIVRREGVRIVARTPAGLFYGVQTFRQLLPYQVEYTAALPAPMR